MGQLKRKDLAIHPGHITAQEIDYLPLCLLKHAVHPAQRATVCINIRYGFQAGKGIGFRLVCTHQHLPAKRLQDIDGVLHQGLSLVRVQPLIGAEAAALAPGQDHPCQFG